MHAENWRAYTKPDRKTSLTRLIAAAFFNSWLLSSSNFPPLCHACHRVWLLLFSKVVLTSMEVLKNMAVEGGASSLQSVELQISLEEMMETCWHFAVTIEVILSVSVYHFALSFTSTQASQEQFTCFLNVLKFHSTPHETDQKIIIIFIIALLFIRWFFLKEQNFLRCNFKQIYSGMFYIK